MRRRNCVLAVDVGASTIRAAVFEAAGLCVDSASVDRTDAPCGLRFDPEQLWRQFCSVVGALSRESRSWVEAICITGHVGTVLLDSEFDPIGDGLGWDDTSGLDDVLCLVGSSTAEILKATGRPALSGSGLAAAVALRAADPRAYARLSHVVSLKDFLNARLTGEVATDFTSAAYTGASLIATRTWSNTMLELLDVDAAILPKQLSSTDVVGSLTPARAGAWGMDSGIPIAVGGPDATVGATYVLGTRTDLVADLAGTTDVLVRLVDDPEHHLPGALLNPYTLSGLWTVGGPTGSTGGALSYWARLLWWQNEGEAMWAVARALESVEPGADGLAIQTSMSGSRFPRWVRTERGSVHGLTEKHGVEHFLRAAAEGASYVVRDGVDVLACNEPDVQVALAGGAARSPELAQMRADILGRPVLVCAEPDVSLLGAALLAIRSAGFSESEGFATWAGTRFEPVPAKARVYNSLYAEWLEVFDTSADPI